MSISPNCRDGVTQQTQQTQLPHTMSETMSATMPATMPATMAEIEMHGSSDQEVAEWHIRQAMLSVMKFERYSSYEALADWKEELVQQESNKERTRRLAEDWLEVEDKIDA